MLALLATARSLEARLEEALGNVGLSLAWYGVLGHLVQAREPLTLSELATRISCVRSNVTQLVDRLEAEGLVKREDDRDDRRIIRASLTPQGRERHRAGEKQLALVQATFAASLSEADHNALAQVLTALK